MMSSTCVSDKRNVSFVDPLWIQTRGLSRDNVLDYFATSPFYDPSSNNQAIRAQGVSVSHLQNMRGLEFNVDPNPHEPVLFIIKKQNRLTPRDVEVIEAYYIMEGTIYQCPNFMHLLGTKYSKIVLYLQQAFRTAVCDSNHSMTGEHSCLQHDSYMTREANKRNQRRGIREFPSFVSTLNDIEKYICSVEDT